MSDHRIGGVTTLMFDFYGTVVDMQSGLTEAIAPYLQAKGSALEPSRVVTWWRRTHFEASMIDALVQRDHTPYRAACSLPSGSLRRHNLPARTVCSPARG